MIRMMMMRCVGDCIEAQRGIQEPAAPDVLMGDNDRTMVLPVFVRLSFSKANLGRVFCIVRSPTKEVRPYPRFCLGGICSSHSRWM